MSATIRVMEGQTRLAARTHRSPVVVSRSHCMSSIRTPILLLDVDGVLNAMRWELPPGWEQGTFNGYMLSWDPTITARLRSLHESGRVEIQWLTTWAEKPDGLLAEPLGLPRGLRERSGGRAATGFAGRLGGESGWWKLEAAREAA